MFNILRRIWCRPPVIFVETFLIRKQINAVQDALLKLQLICMAGNFTANSQVAPNVFFQGKKVNHNVIDNTIMLTSTYCLFEKAKLNYTSPVGIRL